MFNALFKVWDLSLKSAKQSLGYLTKKHAAFATWVEKCGVGILKQLLREHIDNLVGQFGWCEHLVVAQVRDAREYIGVVDAVKQTIVLHSLVLFYNV